MRVSGVCRSWVIAASICVRWKMYWRMRACIALKAALAWRKGEFAGVKFLTSHDLKTPGPRELLALRQVWLALAPSVEQGESPVSAVVARPTTPLVAGRAWSPDTMERGT